MKALTQDSNYIFFNFVVTMKYVSYFENSLQRTGLLSVNYLIKWLIKTVSLQSLCLQPTTLKKISETASKTTPPERSEMKETSDIEMQVIKVCQVIMFHPPPHAYRLSLRQWQWYFHPGVAILFSHRSSYRNQLCDKKGRINVIWEERNQQYAGFSLAPFFRRKSKNQNRIMHTLVLISPFSAAI